MIKDVKEVGSAIQDVKDVGSVEAPRVKTPNRIQTIDYLKGLSMTLIFVLHIAWSWKGNDSQAFFHFGWLVLDFFGPVMFVALSAVGTMFSTVAKRQKGVKKVLTAKTILKFLYLFAIGEIMNAFNLWDLGIFHLGAMNVVTFIAIIQLLVPVIMRVDKKIRIVAIVLIAILYFPLLEWLYQGLLNVGGDWMNIEYVHLVSEPRAALYFLFFDLRMMTPFFSWLIVPLLITTIFDKFIVLAREGAGKDELRKELVKIGRIGLIIFVGSFFFSFPMGWGIASNREGTLNPDPSRIWVFDGVPAFWIRHTPQYLFYSLGLICMLFYYFCKKQVIEEKVFMYEKKINIFGRLSLTAFFLTMIGHLIPIKMTFFTYFPFIVVVIAITIQGFWLLATRAKATGTLEWGLVIFVIVWMKILKKFERRKNGATPESEVEQDQR